VQLIKLICNDSLISHAFSCSVYIISGNSIMREIQVWLANLKERENFEDLSVDGSIILKCILNK